MTKRLGEWIVGHRLLVLVAVLAATGFFAWNIPRVRIASPTIDLFPSTHPYVETFKKYSDVFGGASRVVIQLEVKQGTIFRKPVLEKIRRITKQLELLPGINNYQVLSLAQRKVKELKVDAERGFRAVPVMWPKVPETEAEIEDLRRRVHANRRVHGTLVSLDDQATLIVAGFFEKDLDPLDAYRRIEQIVSREQDEHTSLQMIGRPILLGTIMNQYGQLLWLFAATALSILLVLFLYFRDLWRVTIPVLTALLSAVWGVGFLGVLGLNFDPLVIVVPFIISARALSHSVQLIERYTEELAERGDRLAAARATFTGLFKPGMLGIITDAAGVLLVLTTPIPLLQKLALMGGFWMLSIIVSDLIFNPVLLSYLPASRLARTERQSLSERLLAWLADWCLGRGRWQVLGLTAVLLVVGFVFASRLVIGDVHPGTPMLWPDSKYNRDTERIASRFRNTEEFTVVVEGESRDAIKNPQVLRLMESFQRHMESIPEVGSTSSLVDVLPGIIAILHGADPRWELIPDDPRESGFFLEMIYSSSEPGDLVRYVTIDSQNANITTYLRDHKGETLRRVVAHARQFIDDHPVEGARLRLAGGYGGLLAAINEEVAKHQATVTILAFGIIMLLCALAYRSLVAGLLFLVPLAVSNYITYALMGARQIGLDVNALPVVALGVGLGVDYGLYIVERIREEFHAGAAPRAAIVRALTTAGKAVMFTASTMVFGVIFWAFSFLRFQADMGLLLALWMVMSMLGGLVLLPTIISLVKPRFIFGRRPAGSGAASG